MKIRLTIMTENDKHLSDVYSNYSDEMIESKVKQAWQANFNFMCLMGDMDEKAIVEKCELVER